MPACSPDVHLSLAKPAGLPRPNPCQHWPCEDQCDLWPPRLWCYAAEKWPCADQPAGRPGDQKEESSKHKTQNSIHLQLHQGEERAGNSLLWPLLSVTIIYQTLKLQLFINLRGQPFSISILSLFCATFLFISKPEALLMIGAFLFITLHLMFF